MKKINKIFNMISFLTVLGLAQPALADHHLVRIQTVVKVSDTKCAVNLIITGDNQDAFVNTDAIQLNGDTMTTLEDVVIAGINDSDGNNDNGDHILAMSTSLDADNTLVEIESDLIFDDSFCADFTSDAIFTFLNDGVTEIDTLDASSEADFGADNTALVQAADNTLTFTNLDTGIVGITNNAVELQTLGIVHSSTASCALNQTNSKSGIPLVLIAFVWMSLLIGFKRPSDATL